ncbi:hypothetical protein DN069_13065 [Streptacidiphilus pinicola]|uniref:Uncharacterized protein n=1 Tax=Streptacidiphilus pinicola TaxID=2219663 RepID=A0A2X0IJ72_9ACTN|nr:hypothetical protein [Streptacidiphilus pinicola]RAG85164.1 hypothetical protein DN069_13065 [Streptacidiphilus pinicola]
MEIETLLRQLADAHIPQGDRPEEFHHAGSLTVSGSVVFSNPEPEEWSESADVPPGRHPVHIGAVRHAGSALVTMLLIPLDEPGVIAAAGFGEPVADDYLGPDLGFLWDSTTMDDADLDALVAHVEEELTESDVAWVNAVVDPETGANVLAFEVLHEVSVRRECRDGSGRLLALLYTGAR